MRREPVMARVGGDVGHEERASLADDQPQQSAAAGRVADPLAFGLTDAARDETVDLPLLVDDAQCGVLGLDQVPHAIDDELQHGVEVEDAGDGPGRGIEGNQPCGGPPSLCPRPRGVERQLDGADGLLCAAAPAGILPLGVGVDDEPPQAHAARVSAQLDSLQVPAPGGRPATEAPGTEREGRQRRGLHIEVGAGDAVGGDEALEGGAQLDPLPGGGPAHPGMEGVEHGVEGQPAVGRAGLEALVGRDVAHGSRVAGCRPGWPFGPARTDRMPPSGAGDPPLASRP